LRLPHQMADGTFNAGQNKTFSVHTVALSRTSPRRRRPAVLIPGIGTVLRSRPSPKTIRLALDAGTAESPITRAAAGRTRIAIAGTKLPNAGDVAN
jgi:hypothetical protein